MVRQECRKGKKLEKENDKESTFPRLAYLKHESFLPLMRSGGNDYTLPWVLSTETTLTVGGSTSTGG